MPKTNNISTKERMEIFSKEVLTNTDIQRLFCVKQSKACEIIQAIKSKSDRLHIAGVVHIQDYIDCYNLDIARYVFLRKERLYEVDDE
jgi:hypothetical protein